MPRTIRGFMPVLQWEQVTESRVSTVMGYLPASVSSRIGPIPSLRRTTSLSALKIKSEETKALSRPRSSGDAVAYEESELQLCVQDGGTPPAGVHAQFAQQGSSLVNIAVGQGVHDDRSSFERKAYVDGVSYLLRGLPEDLDPHETNQIQSALPPSMRSISRDGDAALVKRSKSPRSTIHTLVQWLTACLILAIHALIPYLVLLCRYGARVEKEYQVVGNGVHFANAMGRKGLIGLEGLLNMHDGQVGKALSAVFAWLVEGVTRGISDGVGEGMMLVRVNTA